jgi:hypothetical protein
MFQKLTDLYYYDWMKHLNVQLQSCCRPVLKHFVHRSTVTALIWRIQFYITFWHFMLFYLRNGSWGGAVGIASDYELDGRGVGVWVPIWSRIFSSPRRPDMFWSPPCILVNGYWGYGDRGVKLTTHQLAPRLRMCGSIHPLPHTSSWPRA